MSLEHCRTLVKIWTLAAAVGLPLAGQTTASNTFLVHNLVSDLPGIADHQDPNLINPWGNGFGASPFWVGNNGSGTSTLYDGTGAITALVVSIPSAGGALTGGPVTGVIQNTFSSNTAVLDVAAGKPASFLFCAEDGVISGWNSSVDATHAHILFDNSKSGAVYKGCALGGTSTAPLLFAANFNSGNVDVYDGGFTPVVNAKAFVDAAIPAGFAPFNVQNMGGALFVTYAKQDAMKHDDVAGLGNGFVAMFDQSGNLLGNLIAQGSLNSPWGMAIAPATFGPFGGSLLVGNFGDGKINAFNAATGKLNGALSDLKGNPIVEQGLWSLNFGGAARNADPGALYFTAGPGGGPNNDPVESHGLLGSIQSSPSFLTGGIVSAASFVAGPVSPNAWVTIKGAGLSATTGTWQIAGSTLPTAVNGVGVTINGEAAPVSYVSNTQINFLVPADIQPGTAQIQTTNNGLTSATIPVPVQIIAPAFFTLGTNTANGDVYIFAEHADGTFVGPAGLVKGATSSPAKPGETISIFATGFGQTSPAFPNGQVISSVFPMPAPPVIVIDGIVAGATSAGLVGTGVYQFKVAVPTGIQTGDDLVVALLADGETQQNAFLAIASQ
ncbi:MAG TPA: TIGR03118 family protein [Bryobacteraceae bacterium]|jgi:uncharacterized protein (TIGR03118 family)|nr:TIGR03118 family protein [Bryobacteraceae bacterium]